jgi:uncharacterized protein (DUF1501 family)
MLTRRRFLSGSCAFGIAAVASPLVSSASTTEYPGYRAIVCILLGGGNDAFNMLVPHGKRQYEAYRSMRGDLALERQDLLELPGGRAGECRLALHPGMQELHELYANGQAAIMANVGTVGCPHSLRSARDSLPADPMAHTAQLRQWQTCGPIPSATGWAGRIADLMQHESSENNLAMNLSLSGANVLQTGQHTSPVQLESGNRRCPQIPVGVDFQYLNNQMAERLVGSAHSGERERSARSQRVAAENTRRTVDEAPALPHELSTLFDHDPLSQRLAEVARVIAAQNASTARRQIFFVQFDGWDHHHRLLESQASMLPMLSRGLKSFRDALKYLDALDDVTTITTSEFGRSLISNGSGSDHGWASNQIVMGGAINGGQLLGEYPDLSAESPFHIGEGVIAPTTANDEYFAELALWLGVPPAGLGYVLPNLAALRARRGRLQRPALFA